MMTPVRPYAMALTALVIAALSALPCQGAVHTVTDLGDSTPGGAPGQLRRLITDAADGDTIIVPVGVITLTCPRCAFENPPAIAEQPEEVLRRGLAHLQEAEFLYGTIIDEVAGDGLVITL